MSEVLPTAPLVVDKPTGSEQPPSQHHMRAGQLLSISAFWFATNVHWTALLAIVIPKQIELMSGPEASQRLGIMLGLGSIFSLVIPLVVGPLSDRCMSPWGRRRPYMALGVGVNIIGLAIMLILSAQQNFYGYFFGFVIVQIGNNLATGAYQGVIPDAVTPEQRGVASGYMGLMTQLGSAVGAILASVIFAGRFTQSYLAIIIFLAVFMGLTAIGLKEQPLRKKPEPIELRKFVRELWIDPRKYPDFAWVWITRALVMLGFYTVQPFVQYYLRDLIHVKDAEKTSGIIFLYILIAATITGLIGGWLSDIVGRKKIVYVANGLMAITAFGLVFCHSLPQAIAVGVVFGLGYGAYISVDWALGTDVLPNKEEAGKDMAVWHIAMVLPQSIAFPIGGYLVALYGYTTTVADGKTIYHYTANGYMTIFGIAAFALALGAVLLRNVKGAR